MDKDICFGLKSVTVSALNIPVTKAKMKRCTIFFSWLLTSFTAAWSQQVSFIKYTVYDGLVANPVRCIYQDSKGFIWIGSYDGLSRYDGYKFTNYTISNGLSHNLINSLIDINGKLLVAENNGSIDIIQNNKVQKRITTSSAVNIVNSFNNRLLITTDGNGFYEYVNDSLIEPQQEKTGTSLGDFITLTDSTLLCTGVDNDLYIYKKDYSLFLSMHYQGLHFYSLFRDSKKRIWACTGTGLKLLQILPGNKPSILFLPLPSGFNFPLLTNGSVTSMIEEEDGSFWIGTMKGLVKIFPGGGSYVYNEKDGLPSSMINTLYFDKEKNLWIGTSLGLAKWVSENNVVFYNTDNKDFKGDVTAAFPYDSRKVLLKTGHGLQYFYLDTKEFRDIKGTKGFYFPVTGNLPPLIHYENEVGIIGSASNPIIPIQKLDTTITGVLFSEKHSNGTIFLGGFGGVYAIEKSNVKKILPHRITGISIDKDGDIWAATWLNGLFRIRITNNISNRFEVQDFTSLIRQKQIRTVYTDSKKNIWVGTRYAGAFCLSEKSNGEFTVQHFSRQSGLMSDWVTCFAEKSNGDIWVGTYLGLDKLVKLPSGYRAFNFSKTVIFFAEIKSIIPTGDDNWLCVANTGVATFKDENLHKTIPLTASIFSASLGVRDNKLTIFSPSEKISLKPNQNAARFEFGALGFINERQILYSYRLKGSSDTAWSNPENIHEASYASLSPGNYSFEVKTLGWNGEYSSPLSFSFFIRTPFWKQWWFIGLCAALVAALVFALYRYRIKQIMRLQQVRNTIATDLHDDIGSALTNISILAELSSNKNKQTAFSENLPGRISEESTLAQQALDDIIWSVNSNNDTLNQTMARMRRYAAEVFEPVGINCNLDFENIPGDIKLNMEQRKDIYLVFKECLNNVIKHASAKTVFIKIAVERNIFQLKIADDGKGFDTLEQTDRNGLKNIRSRIKKWAGKLSINSTAYEGTTVDCVFPLASPK